MHQTEWIGHLTDEKSHFSLDGENMAPVTGNQVFGIRVGPSLKALAVMALVTLAPAVPALQAQSLGGQTQSQPPAKSQPSQDIPDAPSTVQPPAPKEPPALPPDASRSTDSIPFPGEAVQPPDQQQQAPPAMPPVQTIPAGSRPRNQINPKEDLYTISVSANVVQIPVMVKDSDGRRVDGLLPKDFTVLENGKKQTLTYFTSDPFELSVAIILDTGISDVALQQVNQTYGSLVGAFSPYDEVALYTYSSTVTQVADFSGKPQRLTAALNEMKLVRGRNNGPPVLGGPLGPQGPTVNGLPVGGPPVAPVYTPPRESHVLNDAILRAALDLNKRDRTRRKLIFVISDGRELGSKASYREVMRVLQTHDIQVKAVVVDSSALPVYRQVEKLHHLPGQGYSDILPKYVAATGGGEILPELSRNAIEDAYAQITSESRNQYTLAYSPKAITGPATYRNIEVLVDKRGLNIYTKSGYYPVPSAR
jgi:VWFA-related protein